MGREPPPNFSLWKIPNGIGLWNRGNHHGTGDNIWLDVNNYVNFMSLLSLTIGIDACHEFLRLSVHFTPAGQVVRNLTEKGLCVVLLAFYFRHLVVDKGLVVDAVPVVQIAGLPSQWVSQWES